MIAAVGRYPLSETACPLQRRAAPRSSLKFFACGKNQAILAPDVPQERSPSRRLVRRKIKLDQEFFEQKRGKAKKVWHILRWPVSLGLLALGIVFFLVSALGSLGFMGTTQTRLIKESDWNSFNSTYFSTNTSKGQPYEIIDRPDNWPRETSDKMVYFDKRLVALLTYLAKGPAASGGCPNWPAGSGDPRADKIKLSVASQVNSGLYHPVDNLPSVSTIYRGVGVRVVGMDKIKCTVYYPDPNPAVACLKPIEKKFQEFDIVFDPAKNYLSPQPSAPAPTGVCKPTLCAVNRYPDKPDGTDANEQNAEIYNPLEKNEAWGNLLPPDTFAYDPSGMKDIARSAAIYKMTELVYQMLSIDKSGCADEDGLRGYKKITPFSIVLPQWVVCGEKSGEGLMNAKVPGSTQSVWNNLKELAGKSYVINLQKNSPLAGLYWDPVTFDYHGQAVNRTSTLKGVHVNF